MIWAVRIILTVAAIVMLAMKWLYGTFSSDDLTATIVVILLLDLLLRFVRKRRKSLR